MTKDNNVDVDANNGIVDNQLIIIRIFNNENSSFNINYTNPFAQMFHHKKKNKTKGYSFR